MEMIGQSFWLSNSVRGREGPSFTMGARMQIMPPACQRKDEVDQGSSTSSNFNKFFSSFLFPHNL